VKRRRIDNLL
jgi:(p)ppGpp synthase/HD superfamily hydrolase